MVQMSMPAVRLLFVISVNLAASGCQRGDVWLGELGSSPPVAEGRDAGTLPLSAAMPRDPSQLTSMGGRAAGGSGPSGANAGQPAEDGATSKPPTLPPQSGSGGASSMVMAGAGSVVVARPSAGCGKDPAPVETSIIAAGMRANYLLDVPLAYDKTRAYPVVMAFRSTGVSVEAFRSALSLSPSSASESIVVYPNCPNDATTWDAQRDRVLFDALLAMLEGAYCVDRDRVFVLGHGAGAVFATALGCFRGDILRGFAAFSSAPPPGGCVGEPAAWIAQGTADVMLGLGRANRDYWVEHSGCDASVLTPVSPTPCVAYAGCSDASPVRYCEHAGDASLPSFAASAACEFFRTL
mgnify:FL=1